MSKRALTELNSIMNEMAIIGSTVSLLGWDERTYMPKRGSQWRAKQIGYLTGLHHEKLTMPRVGELLSEVEHSKDVSDKLSPDAVNVRELRRYYDKKTKVPKKLVEEIAQAQVEGQSAWVEARKKNDFKGFLPHLEKIIGLKKQYAEAVAIKS